MILQIRLQRSERRAQIAQYKISPQL